MIRLRFVPTAASAAVIDFNGRWGRVAVVKVETLVEHGTADDWLVINLVQLSPTV